MPRVALEGELEHVGGARVVAAHVGHEERVIAQGVGVVGLNVERPLEKDLRACMYVCMYVRTYVCMYVCMYVGMYVCMYVCM